MSVSRRSFLRASALVLGGAALSACSQPATPAPTAASSPAPALPAASAVPPSPVAASPAPAPSLAASPSVIASPSAVAANGPLVGVTSAWVAQTSNQMIFPLALEAGYFQKYGVNMDLSYINGSNTGIAGILSHSLDMITAAGTAVVGAQASDQDLVMVMGFLNQAVFRVMALPSVTDIDAAKSQTIVVTKVGNSDYFAWQNIARVKGWNLSDLSFVNGNDVPGQVALLQNGQAQVAAFSPPNNVLALEIGAHEVLDTASLDVPEQQTGVILPRDYLQAHRDVVLNIAKASVEAIHRWKVDPDYTKQVINKYLPSNDPQFTDVGYSAYTDVWPQVPFPNRAGLQTVIQEVSSQNSAAQNLTPDQMLDMSVVQELVDSGFINQIYGS